MRALAQMAVVAGAVLAVPSSAWAQAMDTFGMGSRSASLAGAVTADVDDFSAGYYNPAGIVREQTLELGIGWFGASPALEVDGRDSNVDFISGTVFGVAVPGSFGDVQFGFGISAHLPDARISRTRALPRQQPRWEMYDNRPHRTYLAANVAVRPLSWLLVGGGLGFMATSENELDIRGGLDIPNPEMASRLEHEVGFDLKTVRFPQVGVQIVPNEELSFGVVYRGEYQLGSDLATEVVADLTGFGDPIPGYLYLETASINAFSPQQVAVGASYRPIPELRIGLDVTWVDWSDYRSPVGRSDTVLNIAVPPELSDFIEVPDSIASTYFIPAGLTDRFVPRVGVEVRALSSEALELDARAGYYYENTPVPEQRHLTNLIDTDHHVLSAGIGAALLQLQPLISDRLVVDAHVQLSILPERLTRKSSLVDEIGDYRASGIVFAGGLSVGVELE
jgi:long-chain fatty acid transport protein